MSFAGNLKKWSKNDLITTQQAEDILAFEKKTGRSRLFLGLGGIGVLSIILGIASLVASNWHLISPEARIGGHVALNLFLAAITLKYFSKPGWGREVLITLQAGLVMTFIALIGQTLQTQAPLWSPLGIWLILTTPMLFIYSRFFGIVGIWLCIVSVFTVSLCHNTLPDNVANAVYAAMPFALFIPFSLKAVKKALPTWSGTTRPLFWVVIVGMASLAQMFWSASTGSRSLFLEVPMESVITAGAGVLACFVLNVAQRKNIISFWAALPFEWDILLIGSYFFAILPILVSHPSLSVVGAALFCLYWLFIGSVGLRLGIEKLWTLAIILIGIRIFIVYLEVFGSFITQGIGMIFTGVLFLGLAWAAKKIIQRKPKALETTLKGETS